MGQARHDEKWATIKQSERTRNEAIANAQLQVQQAIGQQTADAVAAFEAERVALSGYDELSGDQKQLEEVAQNIATARAELDALQTAVVQQITAELSNNLQQFIDHHKYIHRKNVEMAEKRCKHRRFDYQVLNVIGGVHLQVSSGVNTGTAVRVGVRPPVLRGAFVTVYQHEFQVPTTTANRQQQIQRMVLTDTTVHDAAELKVTTEVEAAITAQAAVSHQHDDDAEHKHSEQKDAELSPTHYVYKPNTALLAKYSMGPETVKVVEARAKNGRYILRDSKTGRFVTSFLREKERKPMLQKFNDKLKGEFELFKPEPRIVKVELKEIITVRQTQHLMEDVLVSMSFDPRYAKKVSQAIQNRAHLGIRPFAESGLSASLTTNDSLLTSFKAMFGAHTGINVLDGTLYQNAVLKVNADVSVLTGYARLQGQFSMDHTGRDSWEVSAGVGGYIVAANLSSKIEEMCIHTLCAKIEHDLVVGLGLTAQVGVGGSLSEGTGYMSTGLGPVQNSFKWKVYRKHK